jgi:isopenicillin N synthase-like dioxygenase
VEEKYELPLININHLNFGYFERDNFIKYVAEVASQYGFFQVVESWGSK